MRAHTGHREATLCSAVPRSAVGGAPGWREETESVHLSPPGTLIGWPRRGWAAVPVASSSRLTSLGYSGYQMSPIAAMMTTSMVATRNRGGAHQSRRRQPRGAEQSSRSAAEIRQATARRRKERMRRRQMRDAQSSREGDTPIVMAYPVPFDSGEAPMHVLPFDNATVWSSGPPAINARLHSSGDWVPPCGGGDWVPPHLRRSLDPATIAEAPQPRATEAAARQPADVPQESTKRQGGRSRRRGGGLGWLQCCYSARQLDIDRPESVSPAS